ncbi:1-deoxy-D-xylulose-5-phosphate reductoisomerase [bacterium]|nr:1-deoxy-D-xylulose-5-phosphate reductoisomerase [bacterium]
MKTPSVKRLALFGATGSIGQQTLDVIEQQEGFQVVVLSAGTRAAELAELALKWRPERITLADEGGYGVLKDALSGISTSIDVGPDAAAEAAASVDYDICLNGLVGVAGLMPSYHALKRGIDLALANKESLVLAGEILNRIAAETGAKILPVDSEHCAIFQCLRGENIDEVARLILTASGGPFSTWEKERIKSATPAEALKHPTWRMGPKISIDSATLMNKGLEVIEAYHLFGVPPDKIDVRIHKASIVHSMIEFIDGSFKAQLGTPDMRHPIQYALNYPDRRVLKLKDDDPVDWLPLEFEMVDNDRFPCLELAFGVLESGGTAAAVLNGADEAAVKRFLDGEIRFGDIYTLINDALNKHENHAADDIETVLTADRWGREFVSKVKL